MVKSKYFSEKEFKACVPPCSLQDMRQSTMKRFDELREVAGIPLVVNCAYRSVAWDKKQGRSGNSTHTRGCAMDIRCNSSATRYKIIKASMEVGFTRIGVGKTFVHLDDDETLPKCVIFDYYE